jgi:hypothetical protein
VTRLQGLYPGVTYLAEFLDHPKWKFSPEDPRAMLLEIFDNNAPGSKWHIEEDLQNRPQGLQDIASLFDRPSLCKMIFIQGITPKLVMELGAKLDIPPQFFASHLIADCWIAEPTWLGNSDLEYPFWISENLPPLPSELKVQNYFQIRYDEIRPEGGAIIPVNEPGAAIPDMTPMLPYTKGCNHKFIRFKRQVSVWYRLNDSGWVGTFACCPSLFTY